MSDDLPPIGPELKALLDAAKDEAPSAAMKAKARAALGLPTPVVPPAGPAPTSAAVTTLGVATVVKAVLVLGLVGGAYTVGVEVGESRAREAFERLPPKTVVVEVPAKAIVPEPLPSPVEPPPVAADASVVVKRPRPVEAPVDDDLPAELALLDAAKRALAGGDGAAALASLQAYATRFPRGVMRTEAELLRLEALLQAGRRADAEAVGKKLVSSTDSELVRTRVRALLERR